jgi:hypothetical protein
LFTIEWDDELGPMWMNKDNLAACVNAYVGVNDLKFEDVTDYIHDMEQQIDVEE